MYGQQSVSSSKVGKAEAVEKKLSLAFFPFFRGKRCRGRFGKLEALLKAAAAQAPFKSEKIVW